MKIIKIDIKNFRSLQDISIELEPDTTLIIGKNNTGKTSLLTLLDIFLSNQSFRAEDFNLNCLADMAHKILHQSVDPYELELSLSLTIEYNENDDLDKLSYALPSLDSEDNIINIYCSYILNQVLYNDFVIEYNQFIQDHTTRAELLFFLKEETILNKYFIKKYYTKDSQNANQQEISIELITSIIDLEIIHAKREVDSSDSSQSKNPIANLLDSLTPNIDSLDLDIINTQLDDIVLNLKNLIDGHFNNILTPIIENLKTFAQLSSKTVSILKRSDVLSTSRTEFLYSIGQAELPEHYNGLGYLNFIHMILQIYYSVNQLKENNKPICILAIEEPEAHSHPQMQYTFIKNINELINKETKDLNTQVLITTHSPHIVSQSDFDSIRYFQYTDSNNIRVKNIKELKIILSDSYNFLHKYLTTQNSELFFTDKAIFVEGMTERILLPAMMRKIPPISEYLPLHTQYISIIEMGGAHVHIFNKFLDFIGVKTLVITDIDSCGADKKKCSIEEGVKSSNSGLNYFFDKPSIAVLKSKTPEGKTFMVNNQDKWVVNSDGNLRIAYQTEENDYHARSFEDAFLSCNSKFITKHFPEISIEAKEWYTLATKIDNKTEFAIDILFYSKDDSDWNIPSYIKEGLEWLQQ